MVILSTHTEVVEKKTISDTPEKDPTVVGTFTYRRFGDFVTGAKSLIATILISLF